MKRVTVGARRLFLMKMGVVYGFYEHWFALKAMASAAIKGAGVDMRRLKQIDK